MFNKSILREELLAIMSLENRALSFIYYSRRVTPKVLIKFWGSRSQGRSPNALAQKNCEGPKNRPFYDVENILICISYTFVKYMCLKDVMRVSKKIVTYNIYNMPILFHARRGAINYKEKIKFFNKCLDYMFKYEQRQ